MDQPEYRCWKVIVDERAQLHANGKYFNELPRGHKLSSCSRKLNLMFPIWNQKALRVPSVHVKLASHQTTVERDRIHSRSQCKLTDNWMSLNSWYRSKYFCMKIVITGDSFNGISCCYWCQSPSSFSLLLRQHDGWQRAYWSLPLVFACLYKLSLFIEWKRRAFFDWKRIPVSLKKFAPGKNGCRLTLCSAEAGDNHCINRLLSIFNSMQMSTLVFVQEEQTGIPRSQMDNMLQCRRMRCDSVGPGSMHSYMCLRTSFCLANSSRKLHFDCVALSNGRLYAAVITHKRTRWTWIDVCKSKYSVYRASTLEYNFQFSVLHSSSFQCHLCLNRKYYKILIKKSNASTGINGESTRALLKFIAITNSLLEFAFDGVATIQQFSSQSNFFNDITANKKIFHRIFAIVELCFYLILPSFIFF